jgi:carbonic anhydrase/acetyltransferase-like protein (isoleucine patch superfamily)
MKKKSSYMTEGLRQPIRPNPNDDWPQVDPTAYIDPTAQVIGNVHIGARVYVGPNAVVRADEADNKGEVRPIEIGPECNVQDGAIVHALGGTQVTVGQRTSLAHGCVIHGPCTIGEGCFIGFRAVIYNATLGDRVFVGTGAVVQGVDLAANTCVPLAVAVLSKEDVVTLASTVSLADCEFMEKIVNTNLALAKGYIRLNEQEQDKGLGK